MSATTQLIPISSPEVDEIIAEMIDSGGELTPEMEIRLQQIAQTGEGAIEVANRIVDLLNYCFTSRMWVKARQLSSKERKDAAVRLKASLVEIFDKHPGSEGTMASPIKSEEGVSISYVSASKTKKGVVDTGNDPALESPTSISGFTEEDIAASEIPLSFFVPHVRYVPNLEMIGEYLDQGEDVGMCKRLAPEAYVRISHPRSLDQAEAKIKAAEAKKRREFSMGVKKEGA